MATINNFALGRSVGALTLTIQTPNASTGVLTGGTAKSILGQFKTWKLGQSNTLEEVSATSARARNKMIIDSGAVVTITGILFAADNGTTTNAPQVVVNTADYVSVACTRAGLGCTVYGVVESYEEEVAGKGAIGFTMVLGEVDINSANPVYA